MAQQTTYTCDRCKESRTDDTKFLKLIRIAIGYGFDAPSVWSASWCAECRKQFGLVERDAWQKPKPEPIALPLIEEVIRQIVREEIGASNAN